MAASPRARAAIRRHRAGILEHLALALVAYVPQLWSRPGLVDADIKSYLYLDPARFLRQSASMWDPTVGLGTVTHEQLGYLWPVGPFYTAVHALGIPTWVGERLWVGSLLFGAGAGVLFLCRTLGLGRPGRTVAAFAFMLSPYFLQDVGRISSLLLPWAGLGWLLGFAIRAVRGGGWRYPALFALVWVSVSALNASGPIYAAVAPALWVLYTVFVSRQHTLGQAWAATWRTLVVTGAVSLWWAWSLLIEGRYGLNILGYTETVAAVAKTATSFEILRGLGYWFFYGADSAGPWAAPLTGFTQNLALVAVSFAVPLAALAGAAFLRWRHRAFFVFLILVGLVLAVGSHPYGAPSVVGGFIKSFMTKTTAGLALRSSDRATPMVLLGLTMLLGAALTAVARKRRLLGLGASAMALALVAVANPAAWNGSTVLSRYTVPTPVPTYVTQAANALNATGASTNGNGRTRVLAIPGDNTAVYRYGDTVDPLWPGVLTRPFVTGQQAPIGALPGYDLLYGLDAPLQSNTADPAALAPMARLMNAGDVLVQNDIAWWLYDRPSPQDAWPSLDLPQPGLGTPVGYGSPTPNVSPHRVVNESVLAGNPASPWPAPVEVLPVADPRPLVRAEATAGALVVAGDGAGVDAAAGLGLLDTNAPVLYAGTLDNHPAALAHTLQGGATLVLTDTNRKELFAWNAVAGKAGPTLPRKAPEPPDTLNIFPKGPPGAQSVAADRGIAAVTSLPAAADHQAVLAIDGDDATSWQTNIGSPASGKWWQVTFTRPVSTDHIRLVQAQPGGYQHQRWITRVNLSFDGEAPIQVPLTAASHHAPGQRINFTRRGFTKLRVTIRSTNLGHASTKVKNDASPVGLAEVDVQGITARQVVAMPTDLLARAGTASQRHRLVIVMTRQRDTPVPPESDPEPVLDRSFTLPTARTFSLAGSASVSGEAPDGVVDTAVGRPAGVTASSSSRLPGDPGAGASAALDGNPATMWMPGMGAPQVVGSWLEVSTPRTLTVDHLDLQVAADADHSVPTRLRVQACDRLSAAGRCPTGSPSSDVALPAVHMGPLGTVRNVPVTFPAVRGHDVTVTFTGVAARNTSGSASRTEPIGIAELGVPGVRVGAAPADLPGTCRSDLISVDGTPVPVAVTGTTASALAGKELSVHLCGADAAGLHLGAGRHLLTTTAGRASGFVLDQIALDSAPGGGAMPPGPAAGTGSGNGTGSGTTTATAATMSTAVGGVLQAPKGSTTGPRVQVLHHGATDIRLRVTAAHPGTPFWLVLGQSINNGWRATVDATGSPLGSPTLVDGFANGWLVNPAHGTFDVTLRWTPQTAQNLALVVSLVAVLVCLALALWPRSRTRPAARKRRESSASEPALAAAGPPGVVLAGAAGADVGGGAGRAHAARGDPAGDGDDQDAQWEGPRHETPVPEPALSASWLPVLANPFAPGVSVPPWVALPAGVVCALVAAVLVPPNAFPLVFLGVGGAVTLSLVAPRLRGVLPVVALGLALGSIVYIVVRQAIHHFGANGSWPSSFEGANTVMWAAVLLLVADAVVGVMRRRRS